MEHFIKDHSLFAGNAVLLVLLVVGALNMQSNDQQVTVTRNDAPAAEQAAQIESATQTMPAPAPVEAAPETVPPVASPAQAPTSKPTVAPTRSITRPSIRGGEYEENDD